MAPHTKSVMQVARALSDQLWQEAHTYLPAIEHGDTARLDPALVACWQEALRVQQCDPPHPKRFQRFQLPEPFAGYGGTERCAPPKLLVVGANPGFRDDQVFPRWGCRGPTARDRYFEFFWAAFAMCHRSGQTPEGVPVARIEDPVLSWSDPITHYANVERAVGPGVLSNRCWQVDALPWKSAHLRLYKRGLRKPPPRDTLALRLLDVQPLVQRRIAGALQAIRPLDGARHALVLGRDAAKLLGLPWHGRSESGWCWELLHEGRDVETGPVRALVVMHPAWGWSRGQRERIQMLVRPVLERDT